MPYLTLITLTMICLFITSCSLNSEQKSPLQKHSDATQPQVGHQQHITLEPLSHWQEIIFTTPTQYSILQSDDGFVIKADSQHSASMIYQAVNIDLNKTPYLHWQWKITHTYNNPNEQSRSGDDYPARLYIAIKGKPYSLFPRALSYVWASHSDKDSHWYSPYSQQAILVAVESGNSKVGEWVHEARNLREDIQQYFGESIDHIEGIAIMTDTDNTQSKAMSYYRDIYFDDNTADSTTKPAPIL